MLVDVEPLPFDFRRDPQTDKCLYHCADDCRCDNCKQNCDCDRFNCSNQSRRPIILASPFCVAVVPVRFPFTCLVASNPVRNAPSVPPTACTPNVSSASS